ncbi:MAG: hypothetical protein AAGB48_07970 [Planctomycetota bacterium]
MDERKPNANNDAEQLRSYLAERDVPCPGCGYNLRGVREPVCPECGETILLDKIKRVFVLLSHRDAPCPSCGHNLRGVSEFVCPACLATFDPWRIEAFLRLLKWRWLIYAVHAAGFGFGLLGSLVIVGSAASGYGSAPIGWVVSLSSLVLSVVGVAIFRRHMQSTAKFGIVFWVPHVALAGLHGIPVGVTIAWLFSMR